jgi:hypothetical protein
LKNLEKIFRHAPCSHLTICGWRDWLTATDWRFFWGGTILSKFALAAAVAALVAVSAANAEAAKPGATVIVAADLDSQVIPPTLLDRMVQSALQNSPGIVIEGSDRTVNVTVYDAPSRAWFFSAVRGRFGQNAQYDLSVTPATNLHVTLAQPPRAGGVTFEASAYRDLHYVDLFARASRPASPGVIVERDDTGATVRFQSAAEAAAFIADPGDVFTGFNIELTGDSAARVAPDRAYVKTMGPGMRLMLPQMTELQLRETLREPRDLKTRTTPEGLDILVPDPTRNAGYLGHLTAALNGEPGLVVTTSDAAMLRLTRKAQESRAKPRIEPAIPDPPPEMTILEKLSVPAFETTVGGNSVIVRARDPRLNNEIANDLRLALATSVPTPELLPDGGLKLTAAVRRPPSDGELESAVKRRLDTLALLGARIESLGAGQVKIEFLNAQFAKAFVAANDLRPALEMRLDDQAAEKGDTTHADRFVDFGEPVWLEKTPFLTDRDVESAKATYDDYNRPAIAFTLTREGAARFAAVTSTSVGRRIGILIDGKYVSAPRIDSPITGGRGMITGDFTQDDVERIARELNAVAGTVPFKVVEVR